ncbi:uncharacterized protein LOC134216332 isoform X2 [Armigeres subalbatus]
MVQTEIPITVPGTSRHFASEQDQYADQRISDTTSDNSDMSSITDFESDTSSDTNDNNTDSVRMLQTEIPIAVPGTSRHLASEQDQYADQCVSDTNSDSSDMSSISDFESDTFQDIDYDTGKQRYEHINPAELLHPHLALTKNEVMLMLLHIFMRHNLTNKALEDLLNLVNIIVGYTSLPMTFYSFSKYFAANEFTRHHLCKSCGLYLGEDGTESCRICGGTKTEYFVSFDIITNLRNVLLRNWRDIVDYMQTTSNHYINDIRQGRVIQNLLQENRIFISFNTDGVAIFNSNIKKSLWPIIVTIHDLPPSLRFLRRNTIVAGLWLGSSDPDLDVFMRPFLNQLQDLAYKGLHIFEEMVIKVFTVACCVDSVARCKLQQIKQFNGYEACSFCKHPGILTDAKQIRYSCVSDIQLRNYQDTVNAMDLCSKHGVPVNGIKGISCLIAIPHFDVIMNCPVDYMHAVLLGVCKQLCNLWFDGFGHEWYIKRHMGAIDDILTSIHSFKEMSRNPRKIADRKTWKANEWQNWLLLYSSVCLKKYLPQKYYDHFLLLVSVIQTFLSNTITDLEIQNCETQLKLFVEQFEQLYGIDEMKYNVHLLLHIPLCVRNYGPLWTFSLFNFEDMNGVLKKYVKGPKDPILQIATRCTLAQVQENTDYALIRHDEVNKFCKNLHKTSKSETKCLTKTFTIPTHIRNTYHNNNFEERDSMIQNRYFFKRSKITPNKTKTSSDDSTFTIYSEGNHIYGVIVNILYSEPNYYLLYRPLDIETEQGLLVIRKERNELLLIETNNSLKKCVKIFAFENVYIRPVEFVPWVD